MAYNLESLIQILDNEFLHPHPLQPWILDPQRKPQVESLLEKARLLKQAFEDASPVARGRVWSVETQIRDAAYEAEDAIESHLVDLLLSSEKRGQRIVLSPPDLQRTIDKLDLANEEFMAAAGQDPNPNHSAVMQMRDMDGPSISAPNPNSVVVGCIKDLNQLKERLLGHQPRCEIIPIVGMGGIGKTTLARSLYDDESALSHFDIRAWVTMSQEYDLRHLLIALLQCATGDLPDEMFHERIDKLALHLYKTLFGRRFLIVLDDMWSFKAWDDVRACFPEDRNGSRIVVTTRELSVANYASSGSLHHQMNFLDNDESWKLLRTKVFSIKPCPLELEPVGRRIANSCGGLPLVIHVVGGVLAHMHTTEESWTHFANDIKLERNVSNILALSYNHLPNHLKPLLLYMGAFPEDQQLHPSKLIRLWVAEGFVKPILGMSLEQAATLHLKALVERNLLLECRQEFKKSYSMHDLLRDLCIQKAQEDKFLYLMPDATRRLPPEEEQCSRRLSGHTIHHMQRIGIGKSNVVRSILFLGTPSLFLQFYASFQLQSIDLSGLQLLKVLDILNLKLRRIPGQLQKLVNLRYLALHLPPNLPCSLSALSNLQTLVLHRASQQPVSVEKTYEISNLPRLRHIKFKGTHPLYSLGEIITVLEDLQTLSTVEIDTSFTKVLESMPNLKKLGIFVSKSVAIPSTVDLTCLPKLEKLKCSSDGSAISSSFLSSLILPPSLKKLKLRKFKIPMGCMERIGALPNLETLQVHASAIESSIWEPTEGGYRKLRYLLIEKLNLVEWIANEIHYPSLECLVVRDCSQLKEIPSDVGNIVALRSIEVHGRCRMSALVSARKIQDEQREMGYDLKVHISASTAGWSSLSRITSLLEQVMLIYKKKKSMLTIKK